MFDYMKRVKALLFLLVLASAGVAAYVYMGRPPSELVLTGIVTTNDVIVSPQIGGRISDLKVAEGDVVKKEQMVAVITPDELRADTAYYAHSAEGMVSQVRESEAALRLQERQTADQIKQAEANLAAAEAQQMAAVADLENAKLELDRSRNLSQKGVEPPQRYDTARTAYDAASAKLDSAKRSEEHTSELQSRGHLVCRLLLEKKKKIGSAISLKKKTTKKEAK